MKNTFWLLALAIPSWAATYTVCVGAGCPSSNNYAKINDAINTATCGDTIQIMAGKGAGDGVTHAGTNPAAPRGAHCGGDNNCTGNNPVRLRYKSCSGTITIETDQVSQLPPAGTRILPSYIDGTHPILPTIFNPAYGAILLADVGGASHTPAHDYLLRGLSFAPGAYNYAVFVGIGENGADFPDPDVMVPTDLPAAISFDQVIARITPIPGVAARRVFTFNQNGGDLTNSWIQSAADGAAIDHQAVSGWCGQKINLMNNYLEAPTEVVFPVGMCPAYSPRTGDVWSATSGVRDLDWELAWSHVTHPAWNLRETWQPGTAYPLGKLIAPTLGIPGNVYGYYALVEGTTGNIEPTWPAAGQTVVDGTVTWYAYDYTHYYSPTVKNFVETKQVDGFYIHHNFFEKNPGNQGDQDYGFTFAGSIPASGQWSTARRIRMENNWVENSGTAIAVRGADLSSPNGAASAYAANVGPWNLSDTNNQLALSIGSQGTVTITLPTGPAVTATQAANAINTALSGKLGMACITLEGSFIIRVSPDQSTANCSSNQGAVAYTNFLTIVSTPNDAAGTLGLPAEGVTIYPCMNPATRQYDMCGQQDGLVVRNNLFKNLNSTAYPAYNRNWVISWTSSGVQGASLSHNTFDVRLGGSVGRMMLTLSGWTGAFQNPSNNAWWPGTGVQVRDNVFSFRQDLSRYYDSNGDTAGARYDFVAINAHMCNVPQAGPQNPAILSGALCPAGTFSRNVMPGATLAASTTMSTDTVNDTAASGQPYNSYPSDNFNDSYSTLTFDQQFRLTKASLQAAGTDFKTPGVDPSELPVILHPTVKASDRAAVLSYTLSDAAARSGYYCAVRVTTQDPLRHAVPPVPADMDPSLYHWPESDANDAYPWDLDSTQRTMIIGLRADLSANTMYWLDLECPGASWSTTFGTRVSTTGTADLTFSRNLTSAGASKARIQYGYAYSRSADAIGTPSLTDAAVCRSCAITVSGVTAGKPLYMRWQELDGDGNVLASLPVKVVLPR